MEFSKSDQIEFFEDKVIHQSAGGFVFYEEPKGHVLYVALLQSPDGKFYIPKGHIIKNENPEETALREIKEELTLEKSPKLVTKMGVDSYIFTLPDDNRTHYKNVHVYIFEFPLKEKIKPLKKEGYINAEWLEFKEALEKVAFERENLLKARQLFYFNRPISPINTINDIKSISVGIPTHNGSLTIYNTLYSIIESLSVLPKDISKKVIICLDHCSDNTEFVVDDFLKNNTRDDIEFQRIINVGSKGKTTVLNTIFKNTDSELLCFVDDDVLLEKKCILNLIKVLIEKKDLRCVYARWVRNEFSGRNPWRRFWYWVLGVKFDIQFFDSGPEYMRGACMMFRRENFVDLPDGLFNEDQFLQFIYWPLVKEINDAIIHFNSVSSITDYYKRFVRITAGSNQLNDEFSTDRLKKCYGDLNRKISYKNIWRLPLKKKLPFFLYKFIRMFVNNLAKVELKINKNHEWFRIKQG